MTTRRKSYIGQKFGKLTITGEHWIRLANGATTCQCVARCECGVVYSYLRGNVVGGATMQCRECKNAAMRVTEQLRKRASNPIYYQWRKHVKGACVKRWESFENFVADIGGIPNGCRIDCADIAKPIGPDNYVWTNRKCWTRSQIASIAVNGERYTLVDCGEILGVSRQRVHQLRNCGRLPARIKEALDSKRWTA